jgi:hypothetical protein
MLPYNEMPRWRGATIERQVFHLLHLPIQNRERVVMTDAQSEGPTRIPVSTLVPKRGSLVIRR